MGERTNVQHTAGPWKVKNDDLGCKSIVANEQTDGDRVFTCAEIGYTDGLADDAEDAANARLIAAAPDLLAALQALMRSRWLSIDFDHNRTHEAVDLRQAATAAIDKALAR